MNLVNLFTLLLAGSAKALQRSKRDLIGQNRLMNDLSYHILHSQISQSPENFIYIILSSKMDDETSFEQNFKLIKMALKSSTSNRKRGTKRFGRRYLKQI
jgi:hypothetical protein